MSNGSKTDGRRTVPWVGQTNRGTNDIRPTWTGSSGTEKAEEYLQVCSMFRACDSYVIFRSVFGIVNPYHFNGLS